MAHTFIKVMSMQTPPLGDSVWPSIDVAPPYGMIGTCLYTKKKSFKIYKNILLTKKSSTTTPIV